MLEQLALADFAGLVGVAFKVSPGSDDSLGLTLIQARTLQPAGVGDRGREPFSLIFRGPLRPVLKQQTYSLENDSLGVVEIFLVPIGTEGDPDGMHYQAIFG